MKYLCFYVGIASFLIFQGCASFEYKKAIEDSQNQWGACSGTTDFGPIDEIRVLKLSRTNKKEKEKFWLEGHSKFVDDEEGTWFISIHTEKEMRGSEPVPFCTTTIEIRPDWILFAQKTDITIQCPDDLAIAPTLKSFLKTINEKWFVLDISCQEKPDL